MNRLEKQVRKMEGSVPSDEVMVWANVPDGWDIQRRRTAVEALARERGYEPPFRFDLRPCSDVYEVNLLFIGTGADLKAFLDWTAKHGKLIGHPASK